MRFRKFVLLVVAAAALAGCAETAPRPMAGDPVLMTNGIDSNLG